MHIVWCAHTDTLYGGNGKKAIREQAEEKNTLLTIGSATTDPDITGQGKSRNKGDKSSREFNYVLNGTGGHRPVHGN